MGLEEMANEGEKWGTFVIEYTIKINLKINTFKNVNTGQMATGD